MSEPWSTAPPPPPPPPVAPSANTGNRATTALVLGIIGVVCCQLCAPFAWYIGSSEVKAIKAGLAPMDKQGLATAGMILGIVGTILLGLTVLWVVFAGGLAFLSAMTGVAGH